MTTIFYAPPESFRDGWVRLPDDEAHHAIRVLRHRPGDEIVVVDGVGGWHRLRLEQVDRSVVQGRVLETQYNVGEPSYRLTIGLALLKQMARFETFLEKAVELGVHAIVPLITARTERTQFRLERARRLLIAAMKQCGRSRLPALYAPRPFAAMLNHAASLRLLCHEQPDRPRYPLQALLQQPPDDALVLIGPEGGFSPQEVQQAEAAGFQLVSLGPRRLRAETAALITASAFVICTDT
ncbi:MAG: RsmE family RNA methyltransferase [Rhodothermus sp.]|nr:RsmE family RNA methyltransferase [Rhodothermus sp.]